MNTKTKEKLAELRKLQTKAEALRTELGFSRPGEVTFLATLEDLSDDIVVVEADGLGGATTSVVEGNFPIDYVTKFERTFTSEREAEEAAEEIAFNGVSPSDVLRDRRSPVT